MYSYIVHGHALGHGKGLNMNKEIARDVDIALGVTKCKIGLHPLK
jgi:hypothetical protein